MVLSRPVSHAAGCGSPQTISRLPPVYGNGSERYGRFRLGLGCAHWSQCRDRLTPQTAVLLDPTILLLGCIELLCPLHSRLGKCFLPWHTHLNELEFLRGPNVRTGT